jgi:hypothetical protein
MDSVFKVLVGQSNTVEIYGNEEDPETWILEGAGKRTRRSTSLNIFLLDRNI